MDSSLQRDSCRLSQEHMSKLAIKERDQFHYNFVNQMNYAAAAAVVAPDSDQEHAVLRGLTITNKNCYFKRPLAVSGTWEQQFDSVPIKNEFNLQTKKFI